MKRLILPLILFVACNTVEPESTFEGQIADTFGKLGLDNTTFVGKFNTRGDINLITASQSAIIDITSDTVIVLKFDLNDRKERTQFEYLKGPVTYSELVFPFKAPSNAKRLRHIKDNMVLFVQYPVNDFEKKVIEAFLD